MAEKQKGEKEKKKKKKIALKRANLEARSG